MALSFFMRKKPTDDKNSYKPRPEKKKGFFSKKSPEKSSSVTASGPTSTPVVQVNSDKKPFYAFIDASNLFWGGKESMGFGVDYRKLKKYLYDKFNVTKIFFYNGVRIFDFEYSILDPKPIDLALLVTHLKKMQEEATEKDAALIEKTLSRINFYQRLEEFGYDLKIKPAKVFYDEDDENQEKPILKANCDVDMTFDMMRYMEQYAGLVAMTGDGDFAPVLQYLNSHERKVVVLSRWERTAKEIKKIAGDNFIDFSRLREIIKLRH